MTRKCLAKNTQIGIGNEVTIHSQLMALEILKHQRYIGSRIEVIRVQLKIVLVEEGEECQVFQLVLVLVIRKSVLISEVVGSMKPQRVCQGG